MSNNVTSPPNRKAALTPAQEAARLEALLRHLERLVPAAERHAFRRALPRPAPLCVRLNRLLPAHAGAVRPALEARGDAVPWCADTFVLADRAHDAPLGNTLECALGALYVQAKATTLAVQVLAPRPGERVLDLAAAPGGKATQIAGLMENEGVLVANEPRQRRMAALVGNLERCGAHHTILTRADGAVLARRFHNLFDRVLLDAPCSGDGIVAKSRGQLAYWSPADAVRKSRQQIGLLRAAFHMLRPGGTLVYSTCSLSTEENEDVLLGLLHRFGNAVQMQALPGGAEGESASPVAVESTPLPEEIAAAYPDSFRHCTRIWPHEHQTEGAFVARLTKTAATTWEPVEAELTLDPGDFDLDAEQMAAYLHECWGFVPPIPAGQQLARTGRQLTLRPAAGARLATALPPFVRAGMRVGSLHKQHLYLSHQAIALWGDRAGARRLELTWPQVQALFAANELVLPAPAGLRGEVICAHGPWSVCRGVIGRDRCHLTGFIPRSLRHARIERLLPG